MRKLQILLYYMILRRSGFTKPAAQLYAQELTDYYREIQYCFPSRKGRDRAGAGASSPGAAPALREKKSILARVGFLELFIYVLQIYFSLKK